MLRPVHPSFWSPCRNAVISDCACGSLSACPISTPTRRTRSSVPIPKFLFNFCVDCESSAAEALDRSQDVVGGFGPLERSGVRIASVDEGVDGRLQLCDRLMRSSLDLLLGEEREEPLDLIDP